MTALQPDRHSTLPSHDGTYGCRLAAIATPRQGYATLAWAIETDQLDEYLNKRREAARRRTAARRAAK